MIFRNKMARYATYATLSVKDKEIMFPEVPCIKSLDERNFIIKNNKIVIIYYHAKWCGPCKTFANGFNKIADDFNKEDVKGLAFVKEDIDLDLRNSPADPEVVPTFHFYKNGVFQSNMVLTGVNVQDIKNNVEKLL